MIPFYDIFFQQILLSHVTTSSLQHLYLNCMIIRLVMDQSLPVCLSYLVGRCIIPVFSLGFRDCNRMPIIHPCLTPKILRYHCIVSNFSRVVAAVLRKLKGMLMHFLGGRVGGFKVYHAQCENGELTC